MNVRELMSTATNAHDQDDMTTFNTTALTLRVLGYLPVIDHSPRGRDYLDGWRSGQEEYSALGDRRWRLEHSDVYLRNVHDPQICAGHPCTIHGRTDHPMRSFPQHWRGDRGIMERTCPHGVGHPDPDSPWAHDSYEWIHGCDGCCLGAG